MAAWAPMIIARSLPPSPSHSTRLRTNGESVHKVIAAQRPRYEGKSWGKWLARFFFHHANAGYAFEVVPCTRMTSRQVGHTVMVVRGVAGCVAKRMDHGDERGHGRGDDSCNSATRLRVS